MADEMKVPEAQSLVSSGGIMAKSVRAQKSASTHTVGTRPVATILSGRALRRAQARRKVARNKQTGGIVSPQAKG